MWLLWMGSYHTLVGGMVGRGGLCLGCGGLWRHFEKLVRVYQSNTKINEYWRNFQKVEVILVRGGCRVVLLMGKQKRWEGVSWAGVSVYYRSEGADEWFGAAVSILKRLNPIEKSIFGASNWTFLTAFFDWFIWHRFNYIPVWWSGLPHLSIPLSLPHSIDGNSHEQRMIESAYYVLWFIVFQSSLSNKTWFLELLWSLLFFSISKELPNANPIRSEKMAQMCRESSED
jgi:hypothetical protein